MRRDDTTVLFIAAMMVVVGAAGLAGRITASPWVPAFLALAAVVLSAILVRTVIPAR